MNSRRAFFAPLFKIIIPILLSVSLPGALNAQHSRFPVDPGPFMINLIEMDGNEWSLEIQRNEGWQHFKIPLQLFGDGEEFLNTPITRIALVPIGGGGLAPPGMNTDVIDWLDQLTLAGAVIDDFDDGGYSDWELILATNGSSMKVESDAATPDGSASCVRVTHGNGGYDVFVGWLEKEVDTVWCLAGDTLMFWLRGMHASVNDVEDEYLSAPPRYKLCQNYPNPFNPATTLTYTLPVGRMVKLKIFDMLGQEVFQLVNNFMEAGTHTVEWDASTFSSGVYFYRITAGPFSDVRQMILLK